MSWFKVDDKLHSHPKWIGLGKGAKALWVSAGSWSSDQLSNGFVPKTVLKLLQGTAREAQQLCDANLWRTVDGGWEFVDWLDWQPSREKVLANRQKEADRKALWREKKKGELV